MTSHLLLITIGPVQDFIAQARRTRDLWYGSHLLSEIARRAAASMVESGARLVFPAFGPGDPELATCLAPLRSGSNQPPHNVANKLLAEVPEGLDPSHLARGVRKAVQTFWRDEVAQPVKQQCRALLADGIDLAWDEQLDTFLEFAAAWAPMETPEAYSAARRAVESAVAARKSLRDFSPWVHLRGGVPKSSLDGARESVLAGARMRDAALARRFRIAAGEELDAVGLIKRAGGKPDQFVPLMNVALASWIEVAEREAPALWNDLNKECTSLGVARFSRSDLPNSKRFPFDAGVLVPDRWKSVFEEQGLGDARSAESWGRRWVAPLFNIVKEPYPYVACLVADGDGMGRAIDAMTSADHHRAFSRLMTRFAIDARRLIEQAHAGSLVYAGGDDVMAFLPLPQALACVEALRGRFIELVTSIDLPMPVSGHPTLSIGLGVGHVMEGMGDLLALGRTAEQVAKGAALSVRGLDRNALAIIVDKRSGGRRTWRARWAGPGGDPATQLRLDAESLEENLSSRKLYEIASMLRRFPQASDVEGMGWSRALALETRRLVDRSHAGEGGGKAEAAGLLLDRAEGYSRLHERIQSWVDRMLIARTFASAVPRVRRRHAEGVSS